MEAPLDPFEYKALLLPGEVEIADQYEKRRRNAYRLGVCGLLRAGYLNNPYVTREVEKYALEPEARERVYEHSPLFELETDASKHRTLNKGEALPLFKDLDRGVQTFVRLGVSGENAKPEDKQAFLKHTAAYSILLHTNMRLALQVARTRYGHSFSDDPFYKDIALETILALSRSLQLFNLNKGWTLSTFAVTAIKTQTDRFITNNSRTIRMPTHTDQEWQKMMKINRKISAKVGREATLDELMAETGYSQHKVAGLQDGGSRYLVSLDNEVIRVDNDSDKSSTLGDMTADPRATDAHQRAAEHNELVSVLDETVEDAKLSTAQKVVLSLRYKIFDEGLEEIAPSIPLDYDGLFNEAAGKEDGLEPIKIARALKDAKLLPKASAPKVKQMEAEVLSILSGYDNLRALSDSPEDQPSKVEQLALG